VLPGLEYGQIVSRELEGGFRAKICAARFREIPDRNWQELTVLWA
jgi:hypothetical protein